MLHAIRNTPNIAGGILALLSFIAAMLILPIFGSGERETLWGVSVAIAAFAFYKGRRAVEQRLASDGR